MDVSLTCTISASEQAFNNWKNRSMELRYIKLCLGTVWISYLILWGTLWISCLILWGTLWMSYLILGGTLWISYLILWGTLWIRYLILFFLGGGLFYKLLQKPNCLPWDKFAVVSTSTVWLSGNTVAVSCDVNPNKAFTECVIFPLPSTCITCVSVLIKCHSSLPFAKRNCETWMYFCQLCWLQ